MDSLTSRLPAFASLILALATFTIGLDMAYAQNLPPVPSLPPGISSPTTPPPGVLPPPAPPNFAPPSAAPSPSLSDAVIQEQLLLNQYTPEVQELIKSSYFGHGDDLPDPEEPAVVLQQYLADRQGHVEPERANAAIAQWSALANSHAQSRHAALALANLYADKAQATNDPNWYKKAIPLYMQATQISLDHGKARYTQQLLDAYIAVGDEDGFKRDFGKILASLQGQTPTPP